MRLKKLKIPLAGVMMFLVIVPNTSFSQSVSDDSVIALSQIYRFNAEAMLTDRKLVFDPDRLTALHAIDALERQQAHSVLASALLLADDSLQSTLIDALSTAPRMSNNVIRSLFIDLKRRNVPLIMTEDDLAGKKLLKERLVRLLSRQTGIEADVSDFNSVAQIEAFLIKIDSAVGPIQ